MNNQAHDPNDVFTKTIVSLAAQGSSQSSGKDFIIVF